MGNSPRAPKFHSDSEADLVPGTGVAIVSLGAERTLTFRAKKGKVECRYPLPAGSLLYIRPSMQADWKHAILPEVTAGGRISLTFRNLR